VAYIASKEDESSLGVVGCGPGCTCAPCRAGSAQLAQWYVPEEETGPAPAPQPREPGRTAGWGSYSFGAPSGWRPRSYLGQPPPGPGTRRVAQAPVSAPMRPVADTTQVPFRWVCRIEAKTQRGHSFGTGVLISPSHVLTAAHVIWPPQELYRTVRVVVSPGYGATSKSAFEADGWAVDPHWNPRECMTSINFDWGLIRLAKPVGSATGHWRNWLPISQAPALPGTPCRLAGYPGRTDDPEATQMFQSEGLIVAGLRIPKCTVKAEETAPSGAIITSHPEFLRAPVTQFSLLIEHDADSSGSMSGGPMWVDDSGSPRLVAIHSGATSTGIAGTGAIGIGRVKRAVLLSQAVQAQIQQLMNGSLRPLR